MTKQTGHEQRATPWEKWGLPALMRTGLLALMPIGLSTRKTINKTLD